MISFPRFFSLKGSEKKIIKMIDSFDITRSENLSFVDQAAIKAAAVPVKLRAYHSLADFVEHMNEKLSAAVNAGAQIVVLPELIGIAPLLLLPKYERILSDYKLCPSGDKPSMVRGLLEQYESFLHEVYFTLFPELACQYGVYLLAGSLYLFEADSLYNRAYLFDPDGDVAGFQDKLHLTREEADMGVSPGRRLELLDTRVGKVSVSIGQDSCYYEVYRIAKAMGAQMMLCPTCCLNYGCRSGVYADVYLRVQETSLYGIKAALHGDVLQRHFGGASGIYCPASLAEEKQGVLQGGENASERVLACRINLGKLDSAFNPYYCDVNDAFSAAFAARHYSGQTEIPESPAEEEPSREDFLEPAPVKSDTT